MTRVPTDAATPEPSPDFLSGGGGMAALMRTRDWSESPLGPPDGWPTLLKSTVALMLPAAAQIVLFWGPEFVALYNDSYAPTIGDKHPRALGRPARENWAELWDDLEPLLVRVRDRGETVFAEDRPFYIERHGGPETVYFDISYSPVRDAAGTVAGVLCLVKETTQTVLADQRLRESEERFRSMADSAPMPTWVTDEIGITFSNRALREFFGVGADELTGEAWTRLIHPEDLPAASAIRNRAWADNTDYRFEARFRRGDGAWRWMHVNSRRRLDSSGELIGYVGMAADLTDVRRVEEELRESEGRFHAMADSIDQMIWSTRPDGYHDYFNQRWYDYTGVPEGSTEGDGWNDIFHPDDREQAWEVWRHSLRTGEPYHIEYRLRHCSGAYRWVLGRAQPVRDEYGKIARWYGTCTDIHDLKEAQEAVSESELRFRNMADHAPVMMWVTEPGGHCTYLNRSWYEFTGQSEAEAEGFGWLDATHPDDKAMAEEAFRSANAQQAPFRVEYRLRRKDGAYRWCIDAASPRFAADGAFLGYVGSVIDIDDRREIENALRASEDRLRLATEAAAVGVWDFDPIGGELRWDAGTKAAFGLSPDADVDYDVFLKGVHPDDREITDAAVQHALDPRGPGGYDVEYRTIGIEDGVERWVAARGRAFFADGAAVRFIGTVIDITAQKRSADALARSEAALREQTRNLETLNEVAANLAGELDLDKVVQMVTDAGVAMSGAQFGAFFYNVINAAGESYMLYTISGVDRSEFDKFPMPRNTAVFDPTFSGHGPVRSDDITKDPRYGKSDPHYGMPAGHLPVRSYLAASVLSRTGEVVGGLFFGHAEPSVFTERHERLLVGIAGQAAVAIDNARLFEAAQREITERRRAQEALADLNASLEQRIAAAIAERERIEEALRQSQKMEAVGQLTGGIAHDFNNLLTVITGNLELAQRQLAGTGNARLERNIANALTGSERAAVLTQRLLAFSRRQPLAPKAIDPNRLVTGMSDLLHRSLGETISVETVLGAGVWRIEIDPNQLENAMLNLAVNARDAMEDGGKLTIETANTHLDRAYVAENSEVLPGQYVAICVTDTGSGMDPDTIARAYEPFFTTKEVGKGTGLGLSMVYGFVKQSGGHVKIYSEPGEGTTVKIYLPRMTGDAAEDEEVSALPVPEGDGRETILVCEDDHDVRAYTVEVLRELGYRVLEAVDAPAALRALDERDGEIDLLFTDIVLPNGMNGEALARQARTLRPDLKVLFTTGYARNAMMHQGRLEPGVELITKPFAYAELAARVRDMLDGAA